MGKSDLPYYLIKTKLEFNDGRTHEGYLTYDWDRDETGFTMPLDSECVCVYTSLKHAQQIARQKRWAWRYVMEINNLRRVTVRVVRLKWPMTVQNLSKSRMCGAVLYYLIMCTGN